MVAWIYTGIQLAVGLACVLLVLAWKYRRATPMKQVPPRVMVVLGSGGHTSEMFGFLSQLPPEQWTAVRPVYIVSETDKDSAGFAERFEAPNRRAARVMRIPRAREVGQSYFSSIFTTLKALWVSLRVVSREQPSVILTNGPGVCVPIIGAAHGIAFAMCLVANRKPQVAFFESFTCVDHLSLSGKILKRVVDVFTVSWPELFALLGGQFDSEWSKAMPNLRYCGPFALPDPRQGKRVDGASAPRPSNEGKESLAVVTVGSTCFDELIQTVDSEEFFVALQQLGITEALIQTGRTSYVFKHALNAESHGVKCNVVEYRTNLAADIRRASLLMSHAGAGTILEAMRSGTRTIVVPNERLMSNHQLQLAKALDAKRLLFYVRLPNLLTTLPALPWDALVGFPPLNKTAISQVLSELL